MSSTQGTDVPAKLVSQLIEESPDLGDIVAEFVQGLAPQVAQLKQAFEKLDWQMLTVLAHRLKGAGGSYGYPDISRLGAEMEQGFHNQDAENFQAWITRLNELVTAAQAGLTGPV